MSRLKKLIFFQFSVKISRHETAICVKDLQIFSAVDKSATRNSSAASFDALKGAKTGASSLLK